MTRLPRPPGWAVRRALRRYRRPLAALCAALAVWAVARAVAPPAPPTAQLTVAARDLGTGTVLGPGDLATVPVPPSARPDGATVPARGSVLAAPMRRGEPFTDVRLVGSGRQLRPPGSVVLTIRTADPAAVLAVRPGDQVDVLAAAETTGVAAHPAADATVARGLVVLAVPGARPAGGGHDSGGHNFGAYSSGGMGDSVENLTDVAPGDGGTTGGLLGGDSGGAPGTPTDTSGVLVVAADRADASRLALATGRPLSVTIVSP